MPPARSIKKNQSAASSRNLMACGFHGKSDGKIGITHTENKVTKPEDSKATTEAEPIKVEDNKAMTEAKIIKLEDSTAMASLTVGLANSNTANSRRGPAQPLAKGERNAEFRDDSASDLTDEAIVRFAEACPKLKKVQLQGTVKLTDEALHAFFRHCPDLTSLEITGTSRSGDPKISGQALEALGQEPSWQPKLKTLILPWEYYENKRFMKAMRSLTKERVGLTVRVVRLSEEKKWGDWEAEKVSEVYKKGRKQSQW